MSVHIHWTEPMEEAVCEPDGDRWCFRCRARRPFVFRVLAPVGVSYYGPTPRIACAVCHTTDGDLFPGRWREWSD